MQNKTSFYRCLFDNLDLFDYIFSWSQWFKCITKKSFTQSWKAFFDYILFSIPFLFAVVSFNFLYNRLKKLFCSLLMTLAFQLHSHCTLDYIPWKPSSASHDSQRLLKSWSLWSHNFGMLFMTCHQGFRYCTKTIIGYLWHLSGLEVIIGYSCFILDHEVIELVLLYLGWLASFLTIMYSFNQFLSRPCELLSLFAILMISLQ
jgi:hypothetical protein